MILQYELSTDELSENLLNSIKSAFQKKRVKITVEESEMDETAYLLLTDANRNALEESLAQLERGEGIRFTPKEFDAYCKEI